MHTHGYISILFCIHIRRDASMTWAPQNLLVDHHKFPLEIFHGFWGVPHKKPPKYHIAGDISNIYIYIPYHIPQNPSTVLCLSPLFMFKDG